MAQIRLLTRRVLQSDTGHRSKDTTMFSGRIWVTEGRIFKGFGRCCNWLVVPVPSRQSRLHKTILQEFYQITFRKNLYKTIEQLQADLDQWLHHYNTERTHQGKMCCGRTPFETMIEGKEIWKEKFVDQI